MARPITTKLFIRPAARARSREVSSFFAQMDELSRRTFEDLADCKPAELEWQPRPGMNTIGMLLAHNALVEAFWLLIASEDCDFEEIERRMAKAAGIGGDDDGMPLAPDGLPPRALRGWSMKRHRQLHDRARRFAKKTAAPFRDADLDVSLRRVRRNGDIRLLNRRWILFHVLEHQAGHYGQMLLLRHLYADRRKQR